MPSPASGRKLSRQSRLAPMPFGNSFVQKLHVILIENVARGISAQLQRTVLTSRTLHRRHNEVGNPRKIGLLWRVLLVRPSDWAVGFWPFGPAPRPKSSCIYSSRRRSRLDALACGKPASLRSALSGLGNSAFNKDHCTVLSGIYTEFSQFWSDISLIFRFFNSDQCLLLFFLTAILSWRSFQKPKSKVPSIGAEIQGKSEWAGSGSLGGLCWP